MQININKETCKGCALCIAECDRQILFMSEEKNSMGYPTPGIREGHLCTGCLKCATVCPECSIEIIKEI